MKISSWPSGERPREKLLAKGADSLSDAELLAILLRTGCKGKSAVELARDLLIKYGSLNNILAADYHKITAHAGIGSAKFAELQAVIEISKRQLIGKLKQKEIIANSQNAKDFLQAQLQNKTREVFAAMFLNSKNQIITYQELFFGTIDSSTVYPREVVKQALNYNASSLILAHNHPSGNAKPSQADEQITKQLAKALAQVNIAILDHIIVGAGETFSFHDYELI